MRTAKEIIVSIGPWPEQGKAQAVELLFDDHTDVPFSLHFGTEQIDRLPLQSDSGRTFRFIAYLNASGAPQATIDAPCHFRYVSSLPCLKPWKTDGR
jgi:hypothetical protein